MKKIPNRIEPIGPLDANIMIISEAPSRDDEAEGKQLVGKSGQIITDCLLKAGVRREDCYITNVVKVRPPANLLPRLSEYGMSTEQFYPELYAEIDRVKPNVILALGNTALVALTGKGEIMKRRGSIMQSIHIKGKRYKVLATLHPAARPSKRFSNPIIISSNDMRVSLKKESLTPDVNRTEREYIINPSYDEIIAELDRLSKSEFLSIDLETHMRSGLIRCVGLGDSADRAFCIPMIKSLKPIWNMKEEVYIWTRIVELLTNPKIKKIAQNAQFELTQLAPYTQGKMHIWMDTLRAHALVYPEMPHGLDFLTSIYTDMEYYKDEGKTSHEKSDFDMLQTYNCKDVVATFESAMRLEGELHEIEMHEFYHTYDNPLMHSLWRMAQRGTKIDVELLKSHKKRLESDIERLNATLESKVGHSLNVKSSKQMCDYLYGELKLPKKFKKGTFKMRADEDALLTLASRFPKVKELSLILDIRRNRTLKETFLEMKLSPDERIRTSYGVTETGRLSSSKDLFDVGANLQNIPKRKGKWIREIFTPDTGKVLMKADLAQADARVVAWLAQDVNLKNVFNSGQDVHKLTASLIFDKPYDKVMDAERNLSKNVVHATNYGTGPNTFAKEVGITPKEAKRIMTEYHKLFPNIKSVFHAGVDKMLMVNRTLVTPFGRKRTFMGRWGDALKREAYAYIPQSSVADIIDTAIVELDVFLPKGADMLIQVHDEIVLQCLPSQVDEVAKLLKKYIEKPILVNGDMLTIPVEIETGPNWMDTEVLEI